MLYYEKMLNGFDVYVLLKKGFNKIYVVFIIKYGFIDNWFVFLGKNEMVYVLDGIVYFFEYKLFEKVDGDVF